MEESYKIVPEGWINVSKLEDFGRVFNGLSGKKKEDFGYGKPFIPYVNVFKNAKVDIAELDFVNIRKGEKQNEVMYGDFIFTTSSETIEEVGMTSVFLVENGKYYLNSFCFIFRLSDLNWLLPEYAQFLFRSEEVRYKISLLGQGSTRYNISKTRLLKELTFNIPKKVTEQRLIASILSKVDEAISQTEKLIVKYSRIKTGLLQDLLTKGIDDHGNIRSEATHKFKDSLLGRIPVEWEVNNLQKVCAHDITYGIVQAGPDFENGVPYIRTGDMSGDKLSLEGLLRTDQVIAARFSRSRVQSGEIVFALRATIGKVLIVPKELDGANLTQGTARISADENVVKNELLLWCLRMPYFKNQILQNQKGTTFFEISLTQLRKMLVSFPIDLNEQKLIIDFLAKSERNIDSARTHLMKLTSQKKGLMQDLLSGKVRVNHLITEMAGA